jgi:ABC-2 type transport system ATP-binding protein
MKKELECGVLRMLGIDAFLNTRVSKMSGGMKKRLSIGCAISKHPPIILLDEPMAALDLACKQAIIEYLKRHLSDGGILLLSTHDVLELELCTRCYILKNGKLEPFEYNGDLAGLVARL